MLLIITLVSIWAMLMLRSGIAEYKYYQSVKVYEPNVWALLGSPKYLKIPLVFVSPKNSKLLANISNQTVCRLAEQHRKAGIQFLGYVVLVMVLAIMYFYLA